MKNSNQIRILLAVECILFGFDGNDYKLLLIQRDFAPEREKWSLMGGFVQDNKSADEAANRILHQLTGLHDVYLEQLRAYSNPGRDPIERVLALAFVALIDKNKYQKQINDDFHARWFPMKELPKMIFDHKNNLDKFLNLVSKTELQLV
ncbi:NUDIX domain-containing protein [Arthrospiribacter ruber]|uniref:NUDIX hydrolase n=1 Tax=Arthrospiribacter ruber TaxID=2487934 RepID=A0A951IY10_9BACT|nr:NUDIX domain-containing protein [Arthrospiribacter ruber]MBW3468214.1 NUDIX hydrolase [Arthrospiribacter ruber]